MEFKNKIILINVSFVLIGISDSKCHIRFLSISTEEIYVVEPD